MNNKTFKIKPIRLAMLLAGIGMAPVSYAVDLAAVEGTWNGITMWGFTSDPIIAAPTTGVCPATPPLWSVGPQLSDTDLVAGDLTINLRNCLTEPVSIVIPGQPASFAPVRNAAGRVTAFTAEAPGNGGTASYTWTGVKPGTYLYQSGSHPAKQVQMGLYGALTIGTYAGTSGDVTLLYSEIDPALHNPPAAATPLTYKPRHYLVNGSASAPTLTAGDTNQPTVLRFLNAGLDFHVPALNSGYMSLVAEDGNPYPFPKQQYSANVVAGKTIDALWQPASAGDHVIYDRRGNGMVANLSISDGGDIIPPVITLLGTDPVDVTLNGTYTDAGATATDDVDGDITANIIPTSNVETSIAGIYSVTYDVMDAAGNTATLTRTVNVLAADTIAPVVTLLGTDPVDVTLDGTYTDAGATATDNIDGDLGTLVGTGTVVTTIAGAYTITYTATDTAGNTATLTRTVNVIADTIAPVITLLGTDPVEVTVGDTYTDAGATATDNIDGDLGTLVGTGTVDTATAGAYTITYTATDAAGNPATLTRTVNVVAPVNNAPVAVEDAATVQRNSTGFFINLTGNDIDADGNLKDGFGNVTNGDAASGTITITTGGITSRGGTVSIVTNGVNYIPKRNFRGSDTFSYTVTDTDGAVSNEVTVRVTVVR